MIRCPSILLYTALTFCFVISSADWIGERADGANIPEALKYNGSVTKISPFLEGRSLVDSLLESRAETCNGPGWQVCASEPGCCPSASLCCPNTPYCKNSTSDICCPLEGVCPSGWECTDLCQCIEAGGKCCVDGKYCQKGNVCVFSPYYGYGCCTDLSCTAYVSNGVTVPLTASTPTQAAATSSAPAPTITQDTYYYFTITWSYYFYYYVTFFQVETTSTVTSSFTTVYTTLSVFADNSLDASASFNSLSSNFVGSTPAEATTALAPPTGSPTSAAPTSTGAAPSVSATLFPSISGLPSGSLAPSVSATLFPSISGLPSSSLATSLHAGGGDGGPTNAGSASPAPRTASIPGSWTIFVLALIAIMPGVAMVLF